MPVVRCFDFAQIALGLISSSVLAAISYKLKWLSASGGLGMVIVGTIVFGLGGIVFAVPLVFFFVSSSFLSALGRGRKSHLLGWAGKIGPRDFRQVLANGGAGSVCTLIYFLTGDPRWFIACLASFCEATADTWATEIGALSPETPISIASLKKVRTGSSGGVTGLGSIAAIAGSLATMLVAFLMADHHGVKPEYGWAFPAVAGLAGSIVDSLLGATAQSRYRCRLCGQDTENNRHCDKAALLERGLWFVDNDLVNFFSTSFASILVLPLPVDHI